MYSACHQNFMAASWARAPFTLPQLVFGGKLGTWLQPTLTSAGNVSPEKTNRRSILYTSCEDVPCAMYTSLRLELPARYALSTSWAGLHPGQSYIWQS